MPTKKSPKIIVPKSKESLMPISIEDVQDRILVLRGEPVILDRDVAELYGVQTKEVNQAVKNNPGKFPKGYIWSIEKEEMDELVKKFDRFKLLKHSTVTPHARRNHRQRYDNFRNRNRTRTELCCLEGKTHHQT